MHSGSRYGGVANVQELVVLRIHSSLASWGAVALSPVAAGESSSGTFQLQYKTGVPLKPHTSTCARTFDQGFPFRARQSYHSHLAAYRCEI